MSVVPLSRLATVTKTIPFAITGYDTGPPRLRDQTRVSGGTNASPLWWPLWGGSAWTPGKSAPRAVGGARTVTVTAIKTARRDTPLDRMRCQPHTPPARVRIVRIAFGTTSAPSDSRPPGYGTEGQRFESSRPVAPARATGGT